MAASARGARKGCVVRANVLEYPMLRRFPIFLMFLLAFAAPRAPALAQDAAPGNPPGVQALADPRQKPAKPLTPPKDVPVAYLEEMDDVYRECEANNLFTLFYDCQCLSVKYLDKRIELGPWPTRDAIMVRINTQCANIPGIAGYTYGVCENRMMMRGRQDYKELCECFGRTVAGKYARQPALNSRYFQVLQRDAYLKCGLNKGPYKPAKDNPPPFVPP